MSIQTPLNRRCRLVSKKLAQLSYIQESDIPSVTEKLADSVSEVVPQSAFHYVDRLNRANNSEPWYSIVIHPYEDLATGRSTWVETLCARGRVTAIHTGLHALWKEGLVPEPDSYWDADELVLMRKGTPVATIAPVKFFQVTASLSDRIEKIFDKKVSPDHNRGVLQSLARIKGLEGLILETSMAQEASTHFWKVDAKMAARSAEPLFKKVLATPVKHGHKLDLGSILMGFESYHHLLSTEKKVAPVGPLYMVEFGSPGSEKSQTFHPSRAEALAAYLERIYFAKPVNKRLKVPGSGYGGTTERTLVVDVQSEPGATPGPHQNLSASVQTMVDGTDLVEFIMANPALEKAHRALAIQLAESRDGIADVILSAYQSPQTAEEIDTAISRVAGTEIPSMPI